MIIMDSKYYINNKTNAILKYNVNRNNRDVVATIVYNELTDLLNYAKTNSQLEHKDLECITVNIARIHKQLYSDIPLKLQKYCENCNSCCNGYSITYLPDCFILGLLAEDGTPFEYEIQEDGIFLLEKQRESECCGNELLCDNSQYYQN